MTEYIRNTIKNNGYIDGRLRPYIHQEHYETPIKEIVVFDRDANEIVEQRNGHRQNNFPNTELCIRKGTDTLVIIVGESWTYGGHIRDHITGMDSTESPESFANAINVTLGSRIAAFLDCDLHQSAWPGDQTTNMFIKLEKLLDYYCTTPNNYKNIHLVAQITDSHRDESHPDLYEGYHIAEMVNRGNIGQTITEWMEEYDLSFLEWAERLTEKYDKNIDAVVWKNFNPWIPSLEKCKKYKNVSIVDCDWSTFIASLEGVALPTDRVLNHAAQLSPDLSFVANITHISDEFRKKHLEYIDYYFSYIGLSVRGPDPNNPLMQQYPNKFCHFSWASQICIAGGWLTRNR